MACRLRGSQREPAGDAWGPGSEYVGSRSNSCSFPELHASPAWPAAGRPPQPADVNRRNRRNLRIVYAASRSELATCLDEGPPYNLPPWTYARSSFAYRLRSVFWPTAANRMTSSWPSSSSSTLSLRGIGRGIKKQLITQSRHRRFCKVHSQERNVSKMQTSH